MLITIRQAGSNIITRELNVGFFGDLYENYERHNKKYFSEKGQHQVMTGSGFTKCQQQIRY